MIIAIISLVCIHCLYADALEKGYIGLQLEKIDKENSDYFYPEEDIFLKYNKVVKKISRKGLKGKVQFINFWATWCGPCAAEMPDMNKLNKAMKGKDFVMMAFTREDNQKTLMQFAKKNKLNFVIYYASNKGNLYDVNSIPTTIIINKKGRIIAKAEGFREWGSKASIDFLPPL